LWFPITAPLRTFGLPRRFAGKGQTIARIVSLEFKVQAEVNQDDIAAVHPGERANVRLYAFGAQEFPATAKLILPNSDKGTQRFTVLLDFVKTPPGLLPGLTGEAMFVAGQHPNTLLIPAAPCSAKTSCWSKTAP